MGDNTKGVFEINMFRVYMCHKKKKNFFVNFPARLYTITLVVDILLVTD